MASKIQMSHYQNQFSKSKKDVDIDNYIGFIKHGANQDLVLKARAIKQSGDLDGYKKLKNTSQCVTGSAVLNDGDKGEKNIKSLNGLIVIDIDGQLNDELRNDKYTYIYHRSFGGDGLCVFVKINPDKFEDSFNGLAQYYFQNYNVTIDQSCKNKNRLRYLSYDPDIYVNDKANKFIPKDVKKFAPPTNTNFIYTKSDFDHILDQIRERQIDLCQEDYHRYIRIGLSLFDKFGAIGSEYFHFICQFGSKYNREDAEKDWKGICKNSQGKCRIGTFYYYCKEAGISIYSEKTKQIITRVKISKAQGNPTLDSVSANMLTAHNITVSPDDQQLIEELINSDIDYSSEIDKDKPKIEQLEDFVINTFEPYVDTLTDTTYIGKDVILSDTEVNDIYISASKNFQFNVSINDIRAIIDSNKIKKVNTLHEFIKNNAGEYSGVIKEYALCIYPQTQYNIWAFKKWIVGTVHNWIAPYNEKIVCPLTLVLTGQDQGRGKTSFLRNIMPKELEQYIIETKINAHDKDSMHMMCKALLILDDEFGGKAFKDVKEYKAVSDANKITQRRPYGKISKTFKRRAGLCGTTNETDILKDVTGNRRILPITVERVDYDKILSINKTHLIIEAYNLLMAGMEWIIRSEEDINYLKDNAEVNQTVLPIEEVFFTHFKLTRDDIYCNEVVFNQGDILEYLNGNSLLKPTKYDLKEVLVKNRLTYQTHRLGVNEVKKGVKLYKKP